MMRGLRIHPRFETLSAFSDGSLAEKRTKRIARHLQGCQRCRREVGRIRDAEQALREVPVPILPPDLLDRVFERRAADIRTILPAEVKVPRRRRLVPVSALTGLALLGAALLTVRASADSSSLVVGEASGFRAVPLRYSPASYFSQASAVRVRVRAWYSDESRAPTVTSQLLQRDGDEFVGSAVLPVGAVYGRLAIEDLSGTRLDVNYGSFWEVWDRAENEPGVRDLLAQLRALGELRARGLILAAELRARAAEMTKAYPKSLDAWVHRAFYDLVGPRAPDERALALDLHRARLRQLDLELQRTQDPAEADLETLLDYASLLGDANIESDLAGRLARVNPLHAALSERRTRQAQQALVNEPRELLEVVEREWGKVGGANRVAAPVGYEAARQVGDPQTIIRWVSRLYDSEPESRDGISRELAGVPGLESEAIRLLQERLALRSSMGRDGARPLYQTVAEFEAVQDRERARLLGALGMAQLRAGQRIEGTRALEESLRLVWNPEVAVTLLGGLHESGTGSPDLARTLKAKLAADPLANVEFAAGEPATHEVEQARADLIAEIRSRARSGRAPTDLPTLLAHAPVTLLGMWQAVPGEEHPLLDRIADASAVLEAVGAQAVLVAPRRWSERLARVATETGVAVLADGDSLIEALGGWYLREYVVLHGGRYWAHHNLDEALRLALLLASQ